MRYQLTFWICLMLIGAFCFSVSAQEATQSTNPATQEAPGKKKKEFEDFAKVTEDSKSYDGFFKLHQKKENLYCEIQPSQLDEPFLCMISVARGLGRGRLLSGNDVGGVAPRLATCLGTRYIWCEKMCVSVRRKGHRLPKRLTWGITIRCYFHSKLKAFTRNGKVCW